MAESKPRHCSECQSESEHNFKLMIAGIDRTIFKEINLLDKPLDGYGDGPIPISLSDYSDSESEDDQNVPLCECLSDISSEEREVFMLSPEYVVGEAVADGSCFFDSFRQGLYALRQMCVTIPELRTICAKVANESPLWLINCLPAGLTLAEFTTRTLLPDSYGDTELHGRLLCQHFKISLCVLEGHAEFGVTRSLVSDTGVRCVNAISFSCPDTIYIINRGRNHFEPLLPISPEFKDVCHAIEAKDVPRLEAALEQHRRVLYYSRAERQLEQCSLRDAILSYNIRILDLLFEHWAGAAFAAHSPHFHNLQRLGRALVKARDSCLPVEDRNQQMVIDVHCIIEFNKFEVELYRQLNDYPVTKSNDRKQRLLQIIDVIITTIDLYELYSNTNIRVTKNYVYDILCVQPLLNDKSTMYKKYLQYAMYEMYYRKLDFCVSKVILGYIHSLKEKLKLYEDSYQKIECALYYFLYRVNEEWRLYMPENRPKGRKHALLLDTHCDFSHIRDDDYRLISGPVIYFEWLKFRKSLRGFKDVLANTSVSDNFREKGSLPPEEVNSLTLVPYLRDEHSLRKVVQYLEGAERAIQRLSRIDAALIVQRVLQVTGECLKSTPKSLHLSPTTKALLQLYIPASTIKRLTTLRDHFSKVRDGKLITRINIEETNLNLFFEVAKDLEWIKKAIIEVLAVYKPMVEKYLLDEGLHLVRDREKEFPFISGLYGSLLNEIQESIAYGHGLYMNLEDSIIKGISEAHGVNITRQLARELGSFFSNKERLYSELYQRDVQIISYVQTLLKPVYSVLQNIEKQLNEWTSIRKELERLQLKVALPEYPNDTVKSIIDEVKSVKCETHKKIQKKLESMKNYSPEWRDIIIILKYIVVNMELFRNHHYERKRSQFTNMLNEIDNMQLNATCVDKVTTLLSFIEYEVKNNWKIEQSPIPKDLLAYKYEAIQRLQEHMSKKKFLTNKEMIYLKNKLNNRDIDQPIMLKILSGEEITVKERDVMFTKIGALNGRCKAIVDNLVINKKRDECALQCMAQRANLLRDAIAGEDVPHLVQKYNQDEGFRILAESLLADIYAVHVARNLWNLIDDNVRLLADISIRNVLEHGNPLLEVIGKMLDSRDFPSTLFSFALRVVEDEPALAELARLYERGVKREQAEREWSGPYTPRYHHYFKLLPSEFGHLNDPQSSDDNQQSNAGKDAKISDNAQVINGQNGNEDIDVNNRNISKNKSPNRKEIVKDLSIFITISYPNNAVYRIKFSKEEVRKVVSFMKKLAEKKRQFLASSQQEKEERGHPKTKAKETENAGTYDVEDDIEVILQKINKLHTTEPLTKAEEAPVKQQRLKCEMSSQEMTNQCSVDESSTIQKRKREDDHIKNP